MKRTFLTILTLVLGSFAHAQTGDFDLAEDYVDQAYRLIRAGDYDSARFYAENAYEIALDLQNDSLLGKSRYFQGVSYRGGAYWDTSVSLLFEAKKYFDKAEQPQHVAKVYNALGEVYYHLRNKEKCILYRQEAAGIFKKLGIEENLAITYTNLGNVYQMHGQDDSSLKYHSIGLEILSRLKLRVDVQINALNARSSTYVFIDQPAKAMADLKLAEELAQSLGQPNVILETRHSKADVLYLTGDKQGCIDSCMSLSAQYSDIFSFHDYLRNYERLAHSYQEIGEHDSAIRYFMWFQTYKDSIRGAADRAKLNETLATFEVDLYESKAKNEQLISAAERGKRKFYAVLLALSLAALIIILVIFGKYKRQKQLTIKTQKEAAEKTISQTREILSKQSQLILEKNRIINELNDSIGDFFETSDESKQKFESFLESKILTKEDWIGFRNYFSLIYPNYISELSRKFEHLTESEERFLCLRKLDLTVNEMADILGVLPKSVHRTKTRFLKKYDLESESELENRLSS